jgi:ABC-type amino acid transport substrate-binding protein
VLGTRTVLAHTFAGRYAETAVMRDLHAAQAAEVEMTPASGPNPVALEDSEGRLSRARRRGMLRVGYQEHRLPFSFRNDGGELVGFDIDLVRELGAELGLAIELVPHQPSELVEHLENDHFDLAVGGLWGTFRLANHALFTRPYLVCHAGLLTLDHRRKRLDTAGELEALGDKLTLAVAASSFLTETALARLPRARVVQIEDEGEFFTLEGVDALVTTAEGGSAWTLAHPEYGVALPIKPPPEVPLVLVVAGRDLELVQVLDSWIESKVRQGAIDRYFDYWIRGGGLEERVPRWSIARDVLGLW